MSRYEVISPLSSSGRRYEPGERVELDPREAADLIRAGVLLPPDEHDARRGAEAATQEAGDVLPVTLDHLLATIDRLQATVTASTQMLADAIRELDERMTASHQRIAREVVALRDAGAQGGATETPPEGLDPSPASDAGEGEPEAKGVDPPLASEAGGGEPPRHDRIADAIATLEPGRADHWTRSGKPEVAALRAATGLGDLSAAERDAVWATVQASS